MLSCLSSQFRFLVPDKVIVTARFAIVVLISLVTACASNPLDNHLALEASWRMQGRIAINTPHKALTLGIRWQQAGDAYDIRLSSTLGLAVAHLQGNKNGVTIQIPGKAKFADQDASELLLRQTGLILPVESLPYWLRGESAPSTQFVRKGSLLNQSNWQINYLESTDGLPTRMRLTQGSTKITFLVSTWQH